MVDRAAVALALASAAFVSVPAGLIPQSARAQERRRRTGPFWELAFGPSVSDSHFRGVVAGGVTYQIPDFWFGFHGEVGTSYGENAFDDTDNVFAAQVVLFARDPSLGEIGVVAGVTTFSDDFKPTTTNFALEGEYYLDRVTLGGSIGVQNPDDGDLTWVGQGGIAFYPNDNLKFTASALFTENGGVGGSIGVEFQPEFLDSFIPTTNVWFAKATTSEEATAIRVGWRIDWGGGSSGSLLFKDRNQRKTFYGSLLGSEGVSPPDNAPYK